MTTIRTLDLVVVQVQVLQAGGDEGHLGQLVVGQLQVYQCGHVEHGLGNAPVAQLVVVEPHKRQMNQALKVVSDVVEREEPWQQC